MTPFTQGQKILEVGGGAAPMFHPNMDVRKLPEVDIVANLSEKWPIESGTYDGVFSKFVIEHVSWRKTPDFVGELFRVLKPGGIAFVISPNTEAQMKWALSQGDSYDKISQCLFGDLDYDENSHKAALNPAFAIKLFRDAGFTDVAVLPFGELKTDMVIEAKKGIPMVDPVIGGLIGENVKAKAIGPDLPGAALWTPEQRKEAYNRCYFDGGRGKVGGYSREGYWDYPIHWVTFEKIMAQKPESVLELGCARGYIVKRLQDAGVRAEGLEVSEHCYLTRVCDGIKIWDLTKTPWPFRDQEFDLCVSIAVLEHIPESAMDAVAAEIRRVSKRGLHGVDFGEHDDGFDKTHCLFRDEAWWFMKLNNFEQATFAPFTQKVVEKDELEKGAINIPTGMGIKLNLGCHRTMFHYGWYNVDINDLDSFAKQFGYIYRRHDLTTGIPAATGVVDLIYACHFLEHLNYDQGLAFLKECKRVLRENGIVRIAVPDAHILANAYVLGTIGRFDEISSDECVSSPYDVRKFWQLLFSGHQAAYDPRTLTGMMHEAGFRDVSVMKFNESHSASMKKETYDMFPDFSLFVEAVL